MYSTMDNVDGKQARRTGTSSPLGELFDHGIDSLNCTLASLLEVATLGFGSSKLGAFTAIIPCLPMFLSTWETYHTHTLYLGYFNGPTEGLIISTATMIISGIYGPQVWSTPLVRLFPILASFGVPEGTSVHTLWFRLVFGMFLLLHVPGCVWNVYAARKAQKLPTLPLLLEWTPLLVFTGACVAWLGSPDSHLLKENHLILFCLTMSLVFGRMTTKIILAHLTRQPFPYWTILLTPLVGGAVLGNLPFFGFPKVSHKAETLYLQGYLVFAVIVYGRWAHLVISSICDYLGINCLTIPYEKQVANAAAAVKSPASPQAGPEQKSD